MKQENINPIIIISFIWIIIPGTLLSISFTHDLRNLTIIYKPNTFIYHICQISDSINSKRIRWHYESSINDTELHCKNFSENSDCFDFYYGSSTSVLVVKEPDLFRGKYTCNLNLNSTHEIKSTGWIDIKLPINEDNQFIDINHHENQTEKLAYIYNVPLIIDNNNETSFGKRIEIGGIFHTECKSIESSSSIYFIWIHLRDLSNGIKTMKFIQHNGKRIFIKENQFSSFLSIYSVDSSDDGDYICIASNAFGRSFSSKRSLIVSERMVLPRIYDNILNHSYFDLQSNPIKTILCLANGYPIPDVFWIRVSDSIILARNRSNAILKLNNQTHGVNKYICEAKNKYGLTRIVIYVLVPNTDIKPILSYTDLRSRSIVLHWIILNKYHNRFNHFIIYYRCLNNFNENDEIINIEDYKQIIVDPQIIDYKFTYRINDLIPFTKYEFRIKGFIDLTPSIYSNPIFIETLETVPDKIKNLHGYIWNETSVVIHWTPPNSINAPNFYYVLFYTTKISIPFNQWSNITIYTYPFYVLSLSIMTNSQLFTRVASVNVKGLILSDLNIINNNSYLRLIPTINQFRCISYEQNPLIVSLQWSINHSNIKNYLLYYSDLTQTTNNDLIRIFNISIDQSSINLLNYKFNISLLNLNFYQYHILRFYLAIIDQNQYQLPILSSPIYCFFSRKFEIDFQG